MLQKTLNPDEQGPLSCVNVSTVAGLGYLPSATPRTHPDDINAQINELAKEFIAELTKQIQTMGYDVLMGAEIEVGIDFGRDSDGWVEDAEEALKLLANEIESREIHTNGKSTLSHAYLDASPELCTKPTRPLQTVRRIEHWHNHLAHGRKSDGFANYSASFVPHDNVNLGQHITLSLHDINGLAVKELLGGAHNITLNSEFSRAMKAVGNKRGNADALMLYNGNASLVRWQERHPRNPEMRDFYFEKNGVKDRHGANYHFHVKASRVENKLPDSACNPYLSVLSTLSCAYLTLAAANKHGIRFERGQHIEKHKRDELYQSLKVSPLDYMPVTSDLEQMRHRFIKSSLTLEALTTAIQHSPEAGEWSQKLDRFKELVMDRALLLEQGDKNPCERVR